ncbi:hypothetical protein [Enterobacter soli]|uniref:hypothetical protein n=1 Tax=Enterobacter soli TaxID=885040 RepID=UPI002F3F60FB
MISLIASSLLVSWALAELWHEGWGKRKRRIMLLVALSLAVHLASWRLSHGA